MDNSFFIDNRVFVKSSHGMHYGTCTDIDFDTVSLNKAAYFISSEPGNIFSPEYLSTNEFNKFDIVAKRVPVLYVTDMKEIAVLDKSVIEYYRDIFE